MVGMRSPLPKVTPPLVRDLISSKENVHVPVVPFLKRSWVPRK